MIPYAHIQTRTTTHAKTRTASRKAGSAARGPGVALMAMAAAASPSSSSSAQEDIDVSLLKPLQDRVLVEPIENEPKTAAGLLLPSAEAERDKKDPVFATVLDVSDEVLASEGVHPGLKKGATVVFEGFSGSEVEFGDRELMFVREKEILAVLE